MAISPEQETVEGVSAVPKRIRLFVAVNLSAALKRKLAQVQQEIASRVGKGAVRWTRAEQLHITLKFLGYVPETNVRQVQANLLSASRGSARLRLGAQGLGCFPGAKSPRVIWVGINGEVAPLLRLQKQIEAATVDWAEPEKREFTPHLTLGRVKDACRRGDLDAIAKFVEANKEVQFGQ